MRGDSNRENDLHVPYIVINGLADADIMVRHDSPVETYVQVHRHNFPQPRTTCANILLPPRDVNQYASAMRDFYLPTTPA
jgi:hypothetical protein